MRKVRSGFYKKHSKPRKNHAVNLLIHFGSNIKKVLNKNIATIRKNKPLSSRSKSYLKRDVSRKEFYNPNSKKRKSRFSPIELFDKYRFALASITLAIISVYWINLVFFTDTFYFKKIHVEGEQEISEDTIKEIISDHFDKRRFFIFPQSHSWFINKKKLNNEIASHYSLKSLNYAPHWPSHTFTVYLEEKGATLTYAANNKFYALDQEGNVIREHNEDEIQQDIPIIYQYDDKLNVDPGTTVLNKQTISAVLKIQEDLNKYPNIKVHSFRLRSIPQKEITIVKPGPSSDEKASEEEQAQIEEQLALAAEQLTQESDINKKIEQLKETLEEINIEKLEEGKVAQLLEEEKTYKPTEDYVLQELEVYTEEGWVLKLGYTVLESNENVNNLLKYFATLNQKVDIQGEVKEYIDLRFNNRIYYR